MSTHIGAAWRAAGLLPIAMVVQCTGSIAPGPGQPGRISDFRHRLLAGVKQVTLAKALRLTQPYVSDVARGRCRTITVENAWKFAAYFGCRIEDLFPLPRRPSD